MNIKPHRSFTQHRAHDVTRTPNLTGTCVTVVDRDHTQYSKTYSKDCVASLEVGNGTEWVSFHMGETTEDKNGRRATRTIRMSIPRDEAETIARHILSGPRDISKEAR